MSEDFKKNTNPSGNKAIEKIISNLAIVIIAITSINALTCNFKIPGLIRNSEDIACRNSVGDAIGTLSSTFTALIALRVKLED